MSATVIRTYKPYTEYNMWSSSINISYQSAVSRVQDQQFFFLQFLNIKKISLHHCLPNILEIYIF